MKCSVTEKSIAEVPICAYPVQWAGGATSEGAGRATLSKSLVGAALPSLLGEDELRNQTPIGQAALKVLQAQREVVAFYYWLPSSLPESGCREIDLLDCGQAASLKFGAHFCRADQEARCLVIRPSQREDRVPAGPYSVDRRHPATAFGREVARRPAEAAAEIEHVHAGLYARTFRMLSRCHDTAAVQLVERPQIAMAGPLGINAGGSKRLVNPL